MQKKLILLNGPPRCGKDTLANMLEKRCGFTHLKITSPLKERVHGLYGMPDAPHDAFDDCKSEKRNEFLGLTPREAYIKVWEKYLLPMHGEGMLIDMLIDSIDNSSNNLFVISDIGFNRESQALFNYYGDQGLLVKIQRPGCDFTDDIRTYVDRKTTMVKSNIGKIPRQVILVNSKTPENMLEQFKQYYAGMYMETLDEQTT